MADDILISAIDPCEEWRPIPGLRLYEASSFGRIRRSNTGYVIKPQTGSLMYFTVGLSEGGRSCRKTVHSLVCSAFHGPRPPGLDCAHLDGVATNNRPENLAWRSRAENAADKKRHGTESVGEQRPNAVLTEEQAIAIRAAPGFQTDIAARYGIGQQHVSNIKSGRLWGYLGTPITRCDNPYLMRRRGSENCNAKLSDNEVRAIRAASGTLKEIADRFGSTLSNVGTIRSGRSWRHLL